MEDFLLRRVALVFFVGWLGLLYWNQTVWAVTTLIVFVLVTGGFISHLVIGVRGTPQLCLSSITCGAGLALFFWLLFKVF